jgi:hypothetical protein
MKNNSFIVTPDYVRHKIQMLENALNGTRSDLAKKTRQMEIDGHLAQIELYEKKLAAEKARLAAMTA